MAETADLLKRAEWGIDGYTEGARSYRLESSRFPGLTAKIFQEKDIPVQVAIGNYELGICGLDWIEELIAKYPSSGLIKLRNLGYGNGVIYMVGSASGEVSSMADLRGRTKITRLVGEYPNLAESFALKNRLRRFSIFPLWGGAEVYPPENAELAIMAGKSGGQSFNHDLVPVSKVLDFNACLLVNRDSWERMDLSEVLASLDSQLSVPKESPPAFEETYTARVTVKVAAERPETGEIRLALPDGHAQRHVVDLLAKTDIKIGDYPSKTGNRRPSGNLDGVIIRVIRPQDMPAQVATGNFDLAVTGKDWLQEHLYQFPSSPVTALVDLKLSRVRIVAVVSNELPADDIQELKKLYEERGTVIRIASEYVNIADKCARDNHIGAYRIIPTWGATEAFLPEDADLLIENTETGTTIARHNLKIIDELFLSTICLIGNKESIADPARMKKMKPVIEAMRAAVDTE